MSSELLATYAGLGIHDGEHYYKGEECLACVKDLIRALRADDSRCEIRRELGRARVLQKDLLSILLSSPEDDTLRNDIIRLLVNLTQPAYLCFQDALPKGSKDFDAMRCYMEVEEHLRRYKEAFTVESVLNVLGSVLADLCQKDWDHRDDDDIIIIERILLLIRNVLHVSPDTQEEKRTEDDVSVHDQLIWSLHINGIDELLLFLGSSSEEAQWCMHVLEIVFLILREQSPSALAATGRKKTAKEKKRDEDLMEEALRKERERKARASKIRSGRHSRFGGTFVVKNQQSISGGERVFHRPITGLKSHSYDIEKRPRRTNKARRPVCDPPSDRLSTFSIRLVLKNVCIQFLECCYNPLMKMVRDNIRHNRSMENDDTYYLWSLRFFMEFCRCHDFRVDIVGETLQLSTFHYLIQLIATYYESMVLEKRDLTVARQWAQRLHYAVQGYHELLQFIHQMSVSKDNVLRDNSKVMLSNLVYHQEYRDVFVSLLRNYNEVVQSKSFLGVLIEATHLYIRLMERYCHGNSHMIVQQKRKKGKAKKSKKRKGGGEGGGYSMTNDQMITLWETLDGRVMELLEGWEPLPQSEIPYDSVSDQPMDEQKLTTMARVREHLIDANHPEAVALFRAARSVWPNEEFGREGMSVSDEMDTMKALLFNPAAAVASARLTTNINDGDEEEEEQGGGGGGGGGEVTYETEFEVRKFIQRFSNNRIVRSYCLILSNYQNNTLTLNHAAVKMLYRLAFELKMAPLLYQISIFRIFHSILQQPASSQFHELQKFSRHVVAGFFRAAAENPLMFVELLFWKTSQDVFELTEGYGALERERARKHLSTMWTREQEEELAELFHRYKHEEDIVACIMAGLPQDIPRTRKQVVKQLVDQELVDSAKQLHKKTKKKTGEWSEEEVALLREVLSQEMEGERIEEKKLIQNVTSYFPERGTRSVASKLKEMGVIGRRNKKGGNTELLSENEAADVEEKKEKKERRNKKRRKSQMGKSKVPHLVMSLSCRGYEEQLSWLETYLRDEARDRSLDDEWEEMCIVAAGDAESKVLTEIEFQQLLSALNLQPPSDTEVYWRIPATMSPRELETAANSLRPCSILDQDHTPSDSESENEVSENEISENEVSENEVSENEVSENEVSKGHNDLVPQQEAEESDDEEVVNEEEVMGVAKRHGNSKVIETGNDVELVIDYGGNQEEEEEVEMEEEGSRSAMLNELVKKKRDRGRNRSNQRRQHTPPSPAVLQPRLKRQRISHRADFLTADDTDDHDMGEKEGKVKEEEVEERERGARNPRKLALESSSESESDSSSESSFSDSDSNTSDGVSLNQNHVDMDHQSHVVTDIQSPVMNTEQLLADTCNATLSTVDTTDTADTAYQHLT